MKKVLLTSVLCLGVFASANAGGYIAGYGSYNTKSEAWGLPIAVGYAFENGIRLEADVFGTSDLSDTKDNFGMRLGLQQAKVLYDFDMAKAESSLKGLKVYAGLGIGAIDYDAEGDYMGSDKTMRTFDLDGAFIGGVKYSITNDIAVDLQYNRGWNYAYAIFDGNTNSTSSGYNVIKLGAVYNF
ncbi:MAG: porin family protein [Alphaproteobacteria bacterium]|nr:porin family protein [Alphaproteobacteria bacterium]